MAGRLLQLKDISCAPMARPVYLQHRTYLMRVGTAVECQSRTSTEPRFMIGNWPNLSDSLIRRVNRP